MPRISSLLALALPLLCGGCLTPAMWGAYQDTEQVSSEPESSPSPAAGAPSQRVPAPSNPLHAASSSTARAVVGGVALGVATPVTVALDVAGGVTVVALSPILLPLYFAFRR